MKMRRVSAGLSVRVWFTIPGVSQFSSITYMLGIKCIFIEFRDKSQSVAFNLRTFGLLLINQLPYFVSQFSHRLCEIFLALLS